MDIGVLGIIVNIITFLLGTVIGYVLHIKSMEKKIIVYDTYTTELFHNGVSLIPELKVLWENKEIKNNLSITNYIFSNKGNKAIRSDNDDMIEPLSIISNNEDTIIWKAIILKEKYKTSKFKISQTNDNSVIIDFKYMESNDEVEIQVIHTGDSKFLEPIGRILDHGKIKSTSEYYKIQDRRISFILFISYFMLLSLALIGFVFKPELNWSIVIMLFVSGFLMPLIALTLMYWNIGIDFFKMFKTFRRNRKKKISEQ